MSHARKSVIKLLAGGSICALTVTALVGCDAESNGDDNTESGSNGADTSGSDGEDSSEDAADETNVNPEAQAAAEEFAEEFSGFASEVSSAVDGWDPADGENEDTAALVDAVPELAAHDDVQDTPMYLAAEHAQEAAQVAIEELDALGSVSIDASDYFQRVTERMMENIDAESELSRQILDGDSGQDTIDAWSDHVDLRMEWYEEDATLVHDMYGDDPISASIGAYAAHQDEVQPRTYTQAQTYWEQADSPSAVFYTGIIRQAPFIPPTNTMLASQGEAIAQSHAEHIQALATGVADGTTVADLPQVAGGYRALLTDGFETDWDYDYDPENDVGIEERGEHQDYVQSRAWMAWRIAELQGAEGPAAEEAITLVNLQMPLSTEGERIPSPFAYTTWFDVAADRVATTYPMDIAGDRDPAPEQTLEWAQFIAEDVPPPAYLAEESATLIELLGDYAAQVDALYSDGDPAANDLEGPYEAVVAGLEELMTQVDEKVESEDLNAAITEALEEL